MDVMGDALCVLLSHQFESNDEIGTKVAAVAFTTRFGASVVGAFMGMTMCNRLSWGWGFSYPEFCL